MVGEEVGRRVGGMVFRVVGGMVCRVDVGGMVFRVVGMGDPTGILVGAKLLDGSVTAEVGTILGAGVLEVGIWVSRLVGEVVGTVVGVRVGRVVGIVSGRWWSVGS